VVQLGLQPFKVAMWNCLRGQTAAITARLHGVLAAESLLASCGGSLRRFTVSAPKLAEFDPFVRPSQRRPPTSSRPDRRRNADATPLRKKPYINPKERNTDAIPLRQKPLAHSIEGRVDAPSFRQRPPHSSPNERSAGAAPFRQRQHDNPNERSGDTASFRQRQQHNPNEKQRFGNGNASQPSASLDLLPDEDDDSNGGNRRARKLGEGRDRDRERRERRLSRTPAADRRKTGEQNESPSAKQPPRHSPHTTGEVSSAPRHVVLGAEVTIKELASALNSTVSEIEEVLKNLGEAPKSSEDVIEFEIAELVCLEADTIAVCKDGRSDDQTDAVSRPAVVAVMGHVDHGKTTLLDALRSTSIASSEAGGITQHIGAFEVILPHTGKSLTFLDTPGHAAFSAMRARGAAVTDVVVLVVAADDSVMPQTLEAISHARAAGCPIVVALSKVDLPSADPPRVLQDLANHGLDLEAYGGDTPVVMVSAPTGRGLRELEDAVLYQAELLNVRASHSVKFEGTVVEAKLDKGQGALATLIVNRGVLRTGQCIVAGTHWGKVRSIRAANREVIDMATPGKPVVVAGIKGVPMAGDEVTQVGTEERARRISEARSARANDYRLSRLNNTAAMAKLQADESARAAALQAQKMARKMRVGGKHRSEVRDPSGLTGEDGQEAEEMSVATLPIIIKGDVHGSVEAVESALLTMSGEQVLVQVIHASVGPVASSDVSLASVTGAHIIAFNVRANNAAVVKEAKAAGVEIKQYRVIYNLLEDIGNLLAGAAPRVQEDKVTGHAQVQQIFEINKRRGKEPSTIIAGCKVVSGTVHWQRSKAYRVVRGGEVVHEGVLQSLKRDKLDAQEIAEGMECGVIMDSFNEFRIGDVLHCICVQERAPRTEQLVGGGMKVIEMAK